MTKAHGKAYIPEEYDILLRRMQYWWCIRDENATTIMLNRKTKGCE
jgi:hypothetical protein